MLRNIVVFEELHQVSEGTDERSDLQESILGIGAREGAKFGFGLMYIDQSLSKLPDSVTGNCQTRICLGVQNGRDAFALSTMLGLSRAQSDYVLALPPRTAVVSYPPYPRAFLMKIREVPEMEPASKEDIKNSRLALLSQLDWKPGKSTATGGQLEKPGRTIHRERVNLPDDEHEYLKLIARDPLTPATVRDSANRVPWATGNVLRQKLRAKELIEEAVVNVGKGGQVLVVAPSRDGWKYLQDRGVTDAKRPRGKGSLAHCYAQHLVAAALTKKHPDGQVAIEDTSLGKAVDVSLRLAGNLWEKGNLTAHEVMCKGEGKEVTNIVQDLVVGYQKVVVCSETAEALGSLKKRCERELTKEELERVEFKRLAEFYREIHPRD